ncbi:MAG: kinase [Acutalibacteraceae bacterium]|nr:kinase [Acutalibacteraceae bacterium]
MFTTRTPFRMSFLGGGTDFPAYFNEYGGCVLSATFNKYSYVTVRELPALFDYKNQFTYSKIERFNSPDELEHPLVREALKYIDIDRVQIAYDADLPARSGIGSSSSFAVGLLNELHLLKGEKLSKMELAKEAIHLERNLCNEAGGVQDQLAVAFGGLNRITFDADGYKILPVEISHRKKKEFNENLLLVFTGFSHFSGEVSVTQQNNIPLKIAELNEMKKLVDEGERILVSGSDLDDFGRLLDYTWKLKRTLSDRISTEEIDELYASAIKAGALGGKILGAGSGGFMLLYVTKDKRENVKKIFDPSRIIPFEFEDDGTKLIYGGGK